MNFEKRLLELDNVILKWHTQFMKENSYCELSHAQKDGSELLICVFSDFMYLDHSQEPENWKPEALERVITEAIPRNIFVGKWIFDSVEPVLLRFFDFLQKISVINNAAELKNRLRLAAPIMQKRASKRIALKE